MLDNNNNAVADIINPDGRSRFFLICEHASNHIPEKYNNLGLTSADLARHIAWDIGAEGVARDLSQLLDATLVLQTQSRLLYDCNRPPHVSGAIPEVSESTKIPGNLHLTQAQKDARANDIYRPFHKSISQLLDQRSDTETIIVTLHSFNPDYNGVKREVDIGIINDSDEHWAQALTQIGQQFSDLDIRLNEPYSIADGVTHTLQLHGTSRGIANVMIEIKNDLIEERQAQQKFAAILAQMLKADFDGSNEE